MKRYEKFNNTFKENKSLDVQVKEVFATKLENSRDITTVDLNGLSKDIKEWLNEEI